jgi:hypothetical protein
MILHRGFRMGWISSVAGGGEESAGPPGGRLLWLNHPGPRGRAGSIVASRGLRCTEYRRASSLGGILT